jgi:hypothetical protein
MRKKVIIICSLAAITALVFWFFQSAPTYNIQRVDSRPRALRQPYQTIKTEYYLDGGSIRIEIVDRDGRMEQFALPSHPGDTNRLHEGICRRDARPVAGSR